MIRTIVTPHNPQIVINIPPQYVQQRVEVIAFTIDKPSDDTTQTHLASQRVLAKDWLSPHENEAWKNL